MKSVRIFGENTGILRKTSVKHAGCGRFAKELVLGKLRLMTEHLKGEKSFVRTLNEQFVLELKFYSKN